MRSLNAAFTSQSSHFVAPEHSLPNEAARNHSQQLLDHIIQRIRSNNSPIPFAEYMQLALYTPGLGYYASEYPKFGKLGDFVTAPEITPLFSQCLARACQSTLHTLGGGAILEIGAGSGRMAIDLLTALAHLESLPDRYFILDISTDLKMRQQDNFRHHCPTLLDRVSWLDTLPTSGFRGIILANELCDAMPAHRFRIHQGEIEEGCVGEQNGQLDWKWMTAAPALSEQIVECFGGEKHPHADSHLPDDYTSEINLNIPAWVKTLGEVMATGVVIVIDYGFPRDEYYHPARHMGTLMCHYRHYAHTDPFFYPGLQDITTHVNFTAIAEAACEVNFNVAGFTNQASFLMDTGLLELSARMQNDPASRHDTVSETKALAQHNHAIQLLTSPAEMGELFKVMALTKAFDAPIKGFSFNDKRYRL